MPRKSASMTANGTAKSTGYTLSRGSSKTSTTAATPKSTTSSTSNRGSSVTAAAATTLKGTSSTSNRGSSVNSAAATTPKGKSSTSNGPGKPCTCNGLGKTSTSNGSDKSDTSKGLGKSGASNGTGKSGTSSGSSTSNKLGKSNTLNGSGKSGTSNGLVKSRTSNGTTCSSTSTSVVSQKSTQQPKRGVTEFSDMDAISEALDALRLTEILSDLHISPEGNTRQTSEKTAYNVAKKEAPTVPGVYRVYRKGEDVEAYIGHSKNVKQRLTHHSYGTQDVDAFLRGEGRDAEVNIELSPTKDDARSLEKSELLAFKEKYGHLPEFNHRI